MRPMIQSVCYLRVVILSMKQVGEVLQHSFLMLQ